MVCNAADDGVSWLSHEQGEREWVQRVVVRTVLVYWLTRSGCTQVGEMAR